MSNTVNEMRVFDKLDKDDNDYINNVIKKRPKIAHNIHSGERHAPIPHCPMNAEMASAVC